MREGEVKIWGRKPPPRHSQSLHASYKDLRKNMEDGNDNAGTSIVDTKRKRAMDAILNKLQTMGNDNVCVKANQYLANVDLGSSSRGLVGRLGGMSVPNSARGSHPNTPGSAYVYRGGFSDDEDEDDESDEEGEEGEKGRDSAKGGGVGKGGNDVASLPEEMWEDESANKPLLEVNEFISRSLAAVQAFTSSAIVKLLEPVDIDDVGNDLIGTAKVKLGIGKPGYRDFEGWIPVQSGSKEGKTVGEVLVRVEESFEKGSIYTKVTVFEARNLPVMDVVGIPRLSKIDELGTACDPFVVVHIGESYFTTKVRPRTLNPVWDQTFEVEGAQEVWLEIFDEDASGFLKRQATSVALSTSSRRDSVKSEESESEEGGGGGEGEDEDEEEQPENEDTKELFLSCMETIDGAETVNIRAKRRDKCSKVAFKKMVAVLAESDKCSSMRTVGYDENSVVMPDDMKAKCASVPIFAHNEDGSKEVVGVLSASHTDSDATFDSEDIVCLIRVAKAMASPIQMANKMAELRARKRAEELSLLGADKETRQAMAMAREHRKVKREMEVMLSDLLQELREIKNYRSPPPVVHSVLKAVLLVLNEPMRELQQWMSVTKKIDLVRKGGTSTLTRLEKFDPTAPCEVSSDVKYRTVEGILKEHRSSAVKKASQAVITLFEYVLSLILSISHPHPCHHPPSLPPLHLHARTHMHTHTHVHRHTSIAVYPLLFLPPLLLPLLHLPSLFIYNRWVKVVLALRNDAKKLVKSVSSSKNASFIRALD
uniref:C2 domain-containing protein n=1 Tax=Palpitomonas bilix TaxID=652834 RepID=A0A7S3GLE6_9EUKA